MQNLMNYLKDELYDKIPPLSSCNMCGKCCVNVNLTMIEFIYMFSALSKKYPQAELISIMNKPLKNNPYSPHDKSCRFLDENGLCLAYEERGFSCRAGGNSSLDVIYLHNCFRKEAKKEKSPFTAEEYWKMMLKLERMDDILRKFKNNLYISRLSLESWISIHLEENIKNKELQKIQMVLREYLDLLFLKVNYKDKIKFSAKVDIVSKAKHKLEENNYGEALKLYENIIKENFDGYFLDEAFYYAGICSEKIGRELEAITYYKKVSRFHPYNKSACVHMRNIIQHASSTLINAIAN